MGNVEGDVFEFFVFNVESIVLNFVVKLFDLEFFLCFLYLYCKEGVVVVDVVYGVICLSICKVFVDYSKVDIVIVVGGEVRYIVFCGVYYVRVGI